MYVLYLSCVPTNLEQILVASVCLNFVVKYQNCIETLTTKSATKKNFMDAETYQKSVPHIFKGKNRKGNVNDSQWEGWAWVR